MNPHTVATVLVDARNVLRSEWPNIPEDELVRLAAAWAEARGVTAVLVFDGPAPAAVDSGCVSVVATRGESADDWLAREARSLPHYWLVTSDRELRARAGGRAERTIGGGAFARELRARGRDEPTACGRLET